MYFFIYFISFISLLNLVAMENYNDEKSMMLSQTQELQKESMEAIIPWHELQPYSSAFCKHVIDQAPEELQVKISQLRNPNFRNKVIVLYGASGSGKTTLARIIAQEAKVPFYFVRAAMLGNEYHKSTSGALRRIGQLIVKNRASLIVDEMDVLTVSPSKKDKNNENLPKALWQLLDQLTQAKLLFIGTTNNVKGMPEPLQTRLATALYEMCLLKTYESRRVLVQYLLGNSICEDPNITDKLVNLTKGISNREIELLIEEAYVNASARNSVRPILENSDFIVAYKRICANKKEMSKLNWDKKEVFNYTVQSIGALANIVSIFNTFFSIDNAWRSLAIQKKALVFQQESTQMQAKALSFQENALALQAMGVEMQAQGLKHQEKSLGIQVESFKGQKQALGMQANSLQVQEDSHWWQKFTIIASIASQVWSWWNRKDPSLIYTDSKGV